MHLLLVNSAACLRGVPSARKICSRNRSTTMSCSREATAPRGATSLPSTQSTPTETDLDGQLNGRLSPSTITPASDGVDVGERLVVERVSPSGLCDIKTLDTSVRDADCGV